MTDPAQIRLLVLDVDGVLTDGSILLDDDGREVKRFNVRDGLGIRVWIAMGFEVAVITRRGGGATLARMGELGVRHVVQRAGNKADALADISAKTAIPASQTAFLGDDWPDLAAMRVVGYPMAVADAEPAVIAAAAFVTTRSGGRGAVREAVEHLLASRGLLDQAQALYDAPPAERDRS